MLGSHRAGWSRCAFTFCGITLFSSFLPAALRADTIALYATVVEDNPAWTNESYAQGAPGNLDCNGTPEQYAYIDTGGTFLRATAFSAPPADMYKYRITRVVVEALCRYDSGVNANIQAEVSIGDGTGYSPLPTANSWVSDPDLCSWRLTTVGDITHRRMSWTAAHIEQIRFQVSKQAGVTAQLRVKAFRINVTRELIDCDGDGLYDGDDPIREPQVTGPFTASVCPGQMVALVASVVSDESVSCTWRRNGEVYTGPGLFQIGNSCYFAGIRAEVSNNEVPYTCTVTNSCGAVTTAPASVRACIADHDCNAVFTVDDLFLYLNDWFTNQPRADVDGRAGTTIDDLFFFLNAWFRGC